MSALTILYFYPRSPCGERPVTARIIDPTFGFLSTLSLRRATNNVLPAYAACGISIHALLAESDEAQDGYKDTVTEFLSTLSLRRATSAPVACGPDADISIHALLAESDATTANKALQKIISIHALLAESDGRQQEQDRVFGISIHALLAESDLAPANVGGKSQIFLSTLSLRRATPATRRHNKNNVFLSTLSLRRATWVPCWALYSSSRYFYPRSPCGERRPWMGSSLSISMISIHALLAESDPVKGICFNAQVLFLSTLSLRRAT